jgi:ribonuclease III
MSYQNNNNTNNSSINTYNKVSYELVATPDEIVSGYINPFNKVNKLITKNTVQNILKKYGIFQNINNLDFYQDAMVHESYTINKIKTICSRDNVKIVKNPDGCVLLRDTSYERLEFLGDAVIENIIVSYLYRRYPDQREGFLSSMKMNLVNRITLGHLAKVIGLNEYLVIGRTLDDLQNARDEDKILCDVFEAFIAAIYLDFNNDKHGFLSSFMSGMGYQVAELFLINLIEDESSQLDITTFILDDRNYKNKIVKLIKRLHKYNPIFKVSKSDISKTGEQILTVQISNPNNKEVIGEGKGQNMKKAEQDASKKTLIKMGYFKN